MTVTAATPWTLSVSQTASLGYPNFKVCYKCINEDKNIYGQTSKTRQTLTNLVTIRQKMDCSQALAGTNGTSQLLNLEYVQSGGSHYPPIPYVASGSNTALQWNNLVQYTDIQKYFSNVNSADCGLLTQCQLLNSGCSTSVAYNGLGKMAASGYAISFRQDQAAGYTETLCV